MTVSWVPWLLTERLEPSVDPPNTTAVAPVKPVPVRVRVVSPAEVPEDGLIAVTSGGAVVGSTLTLPSWYSEA